MEDKTPKDEVEKVAMILHHLWEAGRLGEELQEGVQIPEERAMLDQAASYLSGTIRKTQLFHERALHRAAVQTLRKALTTADKGEALLLEGELLQALRRYMHETERDAGEA